MFPKVGTQGSKRIRLHRILASATSLNLVSCSYTKSFRTPLPLLLSQPSSARIGQVIVRSTVLQEQLKNVAVRASGKMPHCAVFVWLSAAILQSVATAELSG